ncbi:protein of unknown function [Burkholderia multivorans]
MVLPRARCRRKRSASAIAFGRDARNRRAERAHADEEPAAQSGRCLFAMTWDGFAPKNEMYISPQA